MNVQSKGEICGEGEGNKYETAQNAHDKVLKNCTAGTYPSHDHALHPRKTRKDKILSATSNSETCCAVTHGLTSLLRCECR